MAEKTQKVAIVTPERVVYGEEARFVQARGTEGELGILPDHAPLITSLEPGLISVKAGEKWDIFAVAGGFLEVSNNQVVVLADTAERPEEIDVERARRAKERAEEHLASGEPDVNVDRARANLRRALARLAAVEEKKS